MTRSRDFFWRLSLGLFGCFLMISLTILSPLFPFSFLFTLLIAMISTTALWEYYQLAKQKKVIPTILPGLIVTFLLPFVTLYSQTELPTQMLVIGFLFFLFLYALINPQSPLLTLAVSLFGILYITIPLNLAVKINFFFPDSILQDGRWWLGFTLITAKMTDIGGYLFGKTIGKHRIVPTISPNKTWEGTVGGFLLGCLIGSTFTLLSPASFVIPFWQIVILSATISFVAQVGDISESLLKRDAKVKDSNRIPGLGGILDLVDSVIFPLPLVYLYLKITN